MQRTLIITFLAGMLAGCTVPTSKAQRVLQGAGYTDIALGGRAWFACSEDDTLSTRFHAKLGGRHAGGAGGELDRRLQSEASRLKFLEHDIERHHLGERGWMPDGVSILSMKDLAGSGIDGNRGELVVGRRSCRCEPGYQHRHVKHGEEPPQPRFAGRSCPAGNPKIHHHSIWPAGR